jgi:predicted ATPase
MRLKSVYISEFKNLKEFTVEFDGDSFIDVFVGKNGSGKSNFFEALIQIFRHWYEYGDDDAELYYNYTIIYEIEGQVITLEFKNNSFKVNGQVKANLNGVILPENILIYYSGHNDHISNLVNKYQAVFSKKIRTAGFNDSRKFIGVGNEYKELLLSVILMQEQENKSREFIQQKLAISEVSSEVKMVFTRPTYAGSNAFDMSEPTDPEQRYWKPEGITKTFLDRLTNCVSYAQGNDVRTEGYLSDDNKYVSYFNIEQIKQEFADFSPQDLFRQLDNLKTLGLLESINISLKINGDQDADISYFSDGQFQSVYIYSISELFKDKNCITLLDEPDSFLHPEWQCDFLQQVIEITDEAANSNHVLMSSHSAITLTSMPQRHLSVFEVEDNIVKVNSLTKFKALRQLSGNRVVLSESESVMSISTFLKNTTQPVLFTEGVSDEVILETAWKKLHPETERPFCIHSAFDRRMLYGLFARDELRRNHRRRKMFALFDFDDAYDDWKGLNGVVDPNCNPFMGLRKQLRHDSHFAMLLPVPNEANIKCQVLDENDEPWGRGSDSHLAIELLFYKDELIGEWFSKKSISGGGELIEFTGDKVGFAENYIPNLQANDFEILRPLFDYIIAKI